MKPPPLSSSRAPKPRWRPLVLFLFVSFGTLLYFSPHYLLFFSCSKEPESARSFRAWVLTPSQEATSSTLQEAPKLEQILEQKRHVELERLLLQEQVEELTSLLQSIIESDLPPLEQDALASLDAAQKLSKRHERRIAQVEVAKIIFLERSGFYAWLDCGENTLGKESAKEGIKYAPVCYGDRLLGYIDQVHKERARVRLITDPNLFVAARIAPVQESRLQSPLALEEIDAAPSLTHFELEGLVHGRFPHRPVAKTAQVFEAVDLILHSQERQNSAQDQINYAHLLREENFLVGARVETSGRDGRFPKGLRIGELRTLWKNQKGQIGALIWADHQPQIGNMVFILPSQIARDP